MAVEIGPVYRQGPIPFEIREALVETGVKAEVLPPEIRKGYQQYAESTWNSIRAMTYPETGLPADQLRYYAEAEGPTEENYKIDKTNLTNIGFSLASVGAAAAMGFIHSSEAHQKIDRTLSTIANMMEDPEVFVPTSEGKGLFVNWIQPSTGRVLKQWPDTGLPVKQHISTVDHAWLIASSQLISTQFPQFKERIQSYLERMDLPFMFDNETGFFRGCYALNPPGFEGWKYDVMSEARIAYLVGNENTVKLMGNLINRKSERSVVFDSKKRHARASYGGGGFEIFWPLNWVPEDKLSTQWRETIDATIQIQKDSGAQHNGGHYGYSSGLGPDGQYHEYRVPESGENVDLYQFQPVITVSALVNMGLGEPVETYLELQRIHQEFPDLTHINNGDGDTVDTQTGAVQRDQLLSNQANSLLTCWNIVKNGEAQKLFMEATSPAIKDVYQRNPLW
jgi:hypothetical protein